MFVEKELIVHVLLTEIVVVDHSKLETVEGLPYCQNWMFTRSDYWIIVDYSNPLK